MDLLLRAKLSPMKSSFVSKCINSKNSLLVLQNVTAFGGRSFKEATKLNEAFIMSLSETRNLDVSGMLIQKKGLMRTQ